MNHKFNCKKVLPYLPTALKYAFSFILTCAAFAGIGSKHYLIANLVELAVIFAASNVLMQKKWLGQTVNGILLFLYNAQVAVMFFANSYISLLMLTNFDSLKALSGKAVLYISAVILVLIFSFYPVKKIGRSRYTNACLLSLTLCCELGFMMIFGNSYSAIGGYLSLGMQYREGLLLEKQIEQSVQDSLSNTSDEQINEILNFFHKDTVDHYVEKDSSLPEQPNVILIFTEGLSRHIIDDERRIMPNVADYQKKSLSFSNYYNHTFATFRGLSGQLYSGYQLDDYDINPMTSIQGAFKEEGYHTAFINTEPINTFFTDYLNNLGFDEVIGTAEDACNGMSDTVSDKDAYQMLFENAVELNEKEEPFFLSVYTFGTHTSLDSADQIFGDGTDAEINKFYDVDYHFGKFMERFSGSELKDNTIIIFTTDHCTYQDDSFNNSFPDHPRAATTIDEIPFFIYYDGIVPGTINANGRNSLCMVPTVLDYLDITVPNYFLGSSLFATQPSSLCETCYCDSFVTYSSSNDVVSFMDTGQSDEFDAVVQNYYIAREVLLAKE